MEGSYQYFIVANYNNTAMVTQVVVLWKRIGEAFSILLKGIYKANNF